MPNPSTETPEDEIARLRDELAEMTATALNLGERQISPPLFLPETQEMVEQERSVEQAKLFIALIKFQSTLRTVEADSENPHFNQKYASLAALWTAIQKPLAEAELCLIQEPEPSRDGIMLRSTLAHSSGEWRSSRLFIPISEKQSKNPQAYGSALAYAKRYAGGAILGVATTAEDDDGSGAAELRLGSTTPEDKAYKGWMAWGDSQIDLMEKAKSVKQLDRILLDTTRKMEGQPVPEALRVRFMEAYDKAMAVVVGFEIDEDIPQ